jgi:fructose transport system permease protein
MSDSGSPVSNNAAADSVQHTGSAAAEFADRSHTPLERLQHLLHVRPYLSPLIVLAMSYIVFGSLNGRFWLPENQSTMIKAVVVVAILALGQTLIILTAGIDLSVGFIALLSMMVMAKLYAEQGWPAALAIVAGLAVGLVCGALNGALVTLLKLPPFIATLGTFGIIQATMLLYTKGKTVLGPDLSDLHHIAGDIPLRVGANERGFGGFAFYFGMIVMVALYLAVGFALSQTAWGRHVYAVGDDPEAARLSGIRVNRVLFSVYTVAGLLFAIGGWVALGINDVASPNLLSDDTNLNSITAVVIGGTSLFGGRGRLVGTMLGALIYATFDRGLSLAGADQQWRVFASGCLVIIAVSVDQWIRKVKA